MLPTKVTKVYESEKNDLETTKANVESSDVAAALRKRQGAMLRC